VNGLPNLTPILLAFALALEFFAAFTHPTAAIWAHAIQNAGYHISARLDCAPFHELHTHLTNDNANR